MHPNRRARLLRDAAFWRNAAASAEATAARTRHRPRSSAFAEVMESRASEYRRIAEHYARAAC